MISRARGNPVKVTFVLKRAPSLWTSKWLVAQCFINTISSSKLSFSKVLSGTLSECQTVWIHSVGPDLDPKCFQRLSTNRKSCH